MRKKLRLDIYLVSNGYVNSRQLAQRIILAGKVRDSHGKILDKPGHQIPIDSNLQIESEPQFVSRGGDKLLSALRKFPIEIKDRVCLDAGISTGGFTDCLIQHGAKLVYGIDVGYGQVSWKIRNNPNVILFERTNIRYLEASKIYTEKSLLPNLVVADLSFISLKLVFKPILDLLSCNLNEGIFLIKPQFEVGKDKVGKGGVVRDKKYHIEAIQSVIEAARENSWNVNDIVPSPLVGPAGNHEYLAWFSNTKDPRKIINLQFIESIVSQTLI